jgi:hypothetical protein
LAELSTGDQMVMVRHQIDLLELRFAQLFSDFITSSQWEDEGFSSPVDWVRVNCHMQKAAVWHHSAVAEALPKLPQSVDSMAAGEIGFAHVVVLARTACAVGDAFDESDLIDKARKFTPGRLYHRCDHYRHAKDAARFVEEQAEPIDRRRLELSPWEDGSLSFKGFLDPIGGAALRSALEPLATPDGAGDDRDRDRRLADALVELAASQLNVQMQVTSSVETLMSLPGAPAGETELALPISGRTVERLACDASITRVLLDSESVVIDVGRSKRVVSGSRRRALTARDGGCRWPGCERAPRFTQAHHIIHWAHGGGSELENQILLCHRHHWLVHEGGWQLIKRDDGAVETIAPPTPRFQLMSAGPD